jgi:hypothetical protein
VANIVAIKSYNALPTHAHYRGREGNASRQLHESKNISRIRNR